MTFSQALLHADPHPQPALLCKSEGDCAHHLQQSADTIGVERRVDLCALYKSAVQVMWQELRLRSDRCNDCTYLGEVDPHLQS
jgi:hypothetical protein